MTDRTVLIFGSFTEDEIKSLQSQPAENDVEITFGSLDSATLRSVGIFNSKQTELQYFKGSKPLKLVKKENALKTVCGADNASQIVTKTVDGNGSIYDSSPVHFSDGIQELNTNTVALSLLCVSDNVSDPPNQSTSKWHGSEGLTISSEPLANAALFGSSESIDIVDSKENISKASNRPTATVKSLLPRGLVNLGNLCFLNATMQALLSCSPFVQLLQELRSRNVPKIQYPTLRAFVEFISDFDMPPDSSPRKEMVALETGRPFHPVMFESILNFFTPDVPDSLSGRARQEDAQEFLSFVMHQMHNELLKLEGQIPNGNGGEAALVSSMNDDDNWETVGPKNKTAITRTQSFIPSKLSAIFGGQLKSVVKARGIKPSATIQPFLLLHLNICPQPVCTIEDALRLFTAPEILEGYRTSAAGKAEVVSASKSVNILRLPEIMILHLMRFSYGSHGSTKLHKHVHFPMELVLGRELLVSPSSQGRRYELVATITHHGREPSMGHYTANTRHSSGKWLHYDDACVSGIRTSKVLHDQAYVLFYRQLWDLKLKGKNI